MNGILPVVGLLIININVKSVVIFGGLMDLIRNYLGVDSMDIIFYCYFDGNYEGWLCMGTINKY